MTPTTSEAASQYAKLQIQTATKPKKICMLHARCVEFVAMAHERVNGERRDALNRAQNILAQLEASLGSDDPVSKSLFYLYDYCYVLLENGDETDIGNAFSVLAELRNTFDELFRTI